MREVLGALLGHVPLQDDVRHLEEEEGEEKEGEEEKEVEVKEEEAMEEEEEEEEGATSGFSSVNSASKQLVSWSDFSLGT